MGKGGSGGGPGGGKGGSGSSGKGSGRGGLGKGGLGRSGDVGRKWDGGGGSPTKPKVSLDVAKAISESKRKEARKKGWR